MYDPDRMSEDQTEETSSVGGFSDEASLVGFGEGARTPARQLSQLGSPAVSKVSAVPGYMRDQTTTSPLTGVSVPSGSHSAESFSRTPPNSSHGPGQTTTAQDAIRERMAQPQNDMDMEQARDS